jgi:hypothetical protein
VKLHGSLCGTQLTCAGSLCMSASSFVCFSVCCVLLLCFCAELQPSLFGSLM